MTDSRQARRQQQRDGRKAAGEMRRSRVVTQLAVVLGAIVVVAGIVLAVVLVNQNSGGDGSSAPEVDTSIAIGGNPAVPLVVDGSAVELGDPDAPVTLDLFFDYSCPHCQEYDAMVGDTLLELAGSGEVLVRQHPIQIVTSYGARAASTAMCVAEGDPEQWSTVHAALFTNHSQSTDGWRTGEFRSFVSDLGVTDSAVLDCVQSGRFMDWVTSNTTAALDDGVKGTPTLRIDGESTELLSAEGLRSAVAERLAG